MGVWVMTPLGRKRDNFRKRFQVRSCSSEILLF
jgi:hypothetical protein